MYQKLIFKLCSGFDDGGGEKMLRFPDIWHSRSDTLWCPVLSSQAPGYMSRQTPTLINASALFVSCRCAFTKPSKASSCFTIKAIPHSIQHHMFLYPLRKATSALGFTYSPHIPTLHLVISTRYTIAPASS